MPDPAETPRLLCDRMLDRLGRYLRAAGYDTDIAGPADTGATILARCADDRRLLLTCDRALAERAGRRGRALVLPANGLDAAAAALVRELSLDWLYAPFTRCLVDNTPVVPAEPADMARLPPRAREVGGPVMLCPECARLYWPGSHVRRMTAKLKAWQETAAR